MLFPIITLTAFASVAVSAPLASSGNNTSGRLIVLLKDGFVASSSFASTMNIELEWNVLNGFAIQRSDDVLNQLQDHPAVDSIYEDGLVSIAVTQTNAPWGLERLGLRVPPANQNDGALDFTFRYAPAAGSGVDVFVVDTGVQITHQDFGGRARWGATFGPYLDADGNGHGTHCAGTVAGSRFGVAKAASIIAVKVLSDGGGGTFSDVISGMNYAYNQAAASGRPTIVSMSIGGGGYTPVDNAVKSLTDAGIHVVVAAGNNNHDASNYSPARAPSAITVGASSIGDVKAWFSNYGSIVDVFAPGLNIYSAWIGSDTAINSISGTSMATPHVAGLVAYYISIIGNQTPAQMINIIQTIGLKDVLTSLPAGTPNILAHMISF